jgi:hypothetical protein
VRGIRFAAELLLKVENIKRSHTANLFYLIKNSYHCFKKSFRYPKEELSFNIFRSIFIRSQQGENSLTV